MRAIRFVLQVTVAGCVLVTPAAIRAEWARVEREEAAVKNLTLVGNALVCGDPSLLSRSTDGGRTWRNHSTEFPKGGHLRDYRATDGTYHYAMFYGFTYDARYRSADAGKTWKQISKKDSKTLGRAFGLKGRAIAAPQSVRKSMPLAAPGA